MKRGLPLLIATIGLLAMALTSCHIINQNPEFAGTWTGASGPGYTSTFVFTWKTLHEETTDGTAITGSVDFSIFTFDETADHILMYVQSSSGDLKGTFASGGKAYCTYSISGDTLMIDIATSHGYPAAATSGPYTRVP